MHAQAVRLDVICVCSVYKCTVFNPNCGARPAMSTNQTIQQANQQTNKKYRIRLDS